MGDDWLSVSVGGWNPLGIISEVIAKSLDGCQGCFSFQWLVLLRSVQEEKCLFGPREEEGESGWMWISIGYHIKWMPGRNVMCAYDIQTTSSGVEEKLGNKWNCLVYHPKDGISDLHGGDYLPLGNNFLMIWFGGDATALPLVLRDLCIGYSRGGFWRQQKVLRIPNYLVMIRELEDYFLHFTGFTTWLLTTSQLFLRSQFLWPANINNRTKVPMRGRETWLLICSLRRVVNFIYRPILIDRFGNCCPINLRSLHFTISPWISRKAEQFFFLWFWLTIA